MKYISIFFLFALVLVMISCSEDIIEGPIIEEPIIEEPIEEAPGLDFGNLELGDVTQFILFEADCSDLSGEITYTGDTLSWEVTQLENGEAVLTERFTEFSPLGSLAQFDNAIAYTSDYILMPDRWSSNLFFFYGNDTLRVNPTSTMTLVQEECSFVSDGTVFRGNDIAFIEEARIGEYSFNNMTVVSCVPGSVGDAYIVYNNGSISAIFSRDFFSDAVRGWIAIEE